jgi:hypothetical protein
MFLGVHASGGVFATLNSMPLTDTSKRLLALTSQSRVNYITEIEAGGGLSLKPTIDSTIDHCNWLFKLGDEDKGN